MLKKCSLLLMVLCLLTQCILFSATAQTARDPQLQAAFENDSLVLRETQSASGLEEYTLRVSAACYEQNLATGVVEVGPVLSQDGTWVSLDVSSQEYRPVPYFLSPGGSKAICLDEKHAYVAEGNVITMILPNFLRSVRDTYAGFSRFIKMSPLQWVNSEGIAWSPDGRYAVITNHRQILMYMRLIYGLYIIDTQSGELYCADTYPIKITEGGSSVLQACFDASGRYLYYTLFGNAYEDARVSLMCYDMQTGEKQRLLPCLHNAAYPKLQRDSRGRLINLTDATKANEILGLNVYEKQNGSWTSRAYALSRPSAAIRPLYMEIGSADMGVMLHMLRIRDQGIALPGRFFADDNLTGYDELLLIEGEDATQAAVLPLSGYGDGSTLAEKILSGEVLQCLNAKLSPDGRYALLLMMNSKERAFCFLMMDMETLALRLVQTPAGVASLCGANSVPQSAPYPCGYSWFAGNKVVILTEDGLKQYEFAY